MNATIKYPFFLLGIMLLFFLLSPSLLLAQNNAEFDRELERRISQDQQRKNEEQQRKYEEQQRQNEYNQQQALEERAKKNEEQRAYDQKEKEYRHKKCMEASYDEYKKMWGENCRIYNRPDDCYLHVRNVHIIDQRLENMRAYC